MDSKSMKYILAIPHPSRGHVNSMLNLCKILVNESANIIISFVVTEEWQTLICSYPLPDAIRLKPIPNVVPSERERNKDMAAFLLAVFTKMKTPCEQILDELELPTSVILVDTLLQIWGIDLGNQRNIPVALFWPMSAMAFSISLSYDLLVQNGDFSINLQEKGHKRLEYLPGVSSIRMMDLPRTMEVTNEQVVKFLVKANSLLSKAQYILMPTINELEPQAIESLNQIVPIPIYAVGPAIPYLDLGKSETPKENSEINYLRWLDNQPSSSILYISLGSYSSVSSAQFEEMAIGLRTSGVRFLWSARGETQKLNDLCGEKGLVVPWCDQLRVLCHYSIGGFWSHCGWNSVQEGIFAGVPFLSFPIAFDQLPNSKLIVEDCKIGWRVKEDLRVDQSLITREEITGLLKKFMDLENDDRVEIQGRAKQFQEIFKEAISRDGSAKTNINSFITDISSVSSVSNS